VTLAGKTQNAVADANGEWTASFAALPAGGPHSITVSDGKTQIALKDVLVGDVWIASGQSNMEWPLSSASNGAAAIAAANDPLLHEYAVPHSYSEQPEADLEGGSWSPADPQHAGRFSAVAYFFARDLRKALNVPIGIIHTSWGGANVETWMSRTAHALSESEWNAILEKDRKRTEDLRSGLKARIGSLPEVDAGLVDDRPVWADPALDDSNWASLPVPSIWERAGYDGLDGIAWYRTTFTLTEAEARDGVRISLGKIDDDDVTYVNGVEIGRTQGYFKDRVYSIASSALKPGANILALRITDYSGGGGPNGDASLFFLESGGTKRTLAGNWKFKVGAVTFRVDGQRINKIPTVLYNRMIHPLLRFPIKGAIWYQGESNANNDSQARAYQPLFAKLIESWRREWQGSARDFPFLWVQLPNYGALDTVPPTSAGWALLRESQTAALTLPKTGQVVTIDVGGATELHPTRKEPVGQRLALVARRVAYGEKLVTSGPRYRRQTVNGNTVVIEFDDVGSGLVSHADKLKGFAIAGADRHWVWADARIEGDRVIVSSAHVQHPVAVRYAWGNSPDAPSLYNREGLPGEPFRTDTW
jgi:sialate O-acetylesterase